MNPDRPDQTHSGSNDDGSAEGFFSRLLATFLGGDDPDREKRRLLKNLTKELKRRKSKLYKPRNEEAGVGIAKFFFDIYRVVAPAQAILQNASESGGVKSIVIDSFLSEEQRELRERFSEDTIRERAKSTETKALAEELRQTMISFFGSFDSKKVKEINGLYNQLLLLLQFIQFDYYMLLKKFDSSLMEGDQAYKPKFEPISAEYIIDDLKDFLEVALPLDPSVDWDKVLDVLQTYRGVEVISRPAWKKVMQAVKEMRDSELFPMIIQHVEKDPFWKPMVRIPNEKIVEAYLNALKTSTEGTMQKILTERKNLKVDQLCRQVFGTSSVVRAKHYTEQANAVYAKRMLAGYTHAAAFNYMKAFLLDYFKKDIREVVRDLLLVRGKWSSNISSQQLSDGFHQVMEAADKAVKFDDSLAEDGERGAKLKKALGRVVERDKNSIRFIREGLKQVNTEAQVMINEAANGLITIAKHLKALLEDRKKTNPELLLNWKEIEAAGEESIDQRMIAIYKRIHAFVQLMQMHVRS